jgi:anti-sigma factor RsiW
MDAHAEWMRQVEAEIEGELSLAERAALARHLASCPHCAGARASHLELRAALASSAGEPHAHAVPTGRRARPSLVAIVLLLVIGLAAGWFGHRYWSASGGASLEASRATIVAP